MSLVQRNIVAVFAIFLLVAAVAITVWLAVLATQGSYVDDPNKDRPQLLEIWALALWFIKKGALLKVTFAGLLSIVGAGMAEASSLAKRGWQLSLLCLICLAGIGASTLVMAKVDTTEALATLRWFGEFQTDAQAEAAVNWLFGALIAWFALFAATLLGIRLKYPNLLGRGNSSTSSPPAAGD